MAVQDDDKVDLVVKRGPPIWVWLIAVALLFVGGGAGLYVMLSRPAHSDEGADEEGEEGEEGSEEGPRELGPLIELAPIVVNLDENDSDRLMRAIFQLEVRNEEAQQRVEARLVPLRSAIFLHLSSMHAGDVQGREKREQLLEQIRELSKPIVGNRTIRAVYISELVVQ